MSKEIKVAYCIKDINSEYITIHEGACFLVKGECLEGFHAGGTDAIKKLKLSSWQKDGHFSYYDVSEKCLICKYNKFVDNGYYCNNFECVRGD